MTTRAAIRPGTAADAAACRAVYAPYVLRSTVTFEDAVPSEQEMGARITRALDSHAWVVAERAGRVVGYAYAGPVKERAAYAWSSEVSVYLADEARGQGLGRALYEALFAALAERGYVRLLAVVALPNEPSLALHRALGFREAGRLERIGFKHGRWRDVAWLQRDLGPGDPGAPPEAAR